MLNETLITFDTDWAPNWCVRDCYEICKQAGFGATFFATDYLPVLSEIANDPMFEIGIHPNFFPGSSHGDDERTVLKYCLSLLEELGVDDTNEISMRTHGLYQSSQLFYLIASEFPQIRRDVSLFMPFISGLKPFYYTMFSNIPTLIRIPFFWEDDYAAAIDKYNWQFTEKLEGLKIFNFHPMHISLNMKDMNLFENMKKNHCIPEMKPSDIEEYKNKKTRGARDFLNTLLNMTEPSRFINTISSIPVDGEK